MNMDVSRYVSAEEEKEERAKGLKDRSGNFTTEYYLSMTGEITGFPSRSSKGVNPAALPE